MSRKKSLKELQAIAAQLSKRTLADYQIPPGIKEQLVLGSVLEGDDWVFELYVPGAKPSDAQVIARYRVNASTGDAVVAAVYLPKKH